MIGTKRAVVALLLVVGLLAVGFAAASTTAEASAADDVIVVEWVTGADPDVSGGDKTGDKGLLTVGDVGQVTQTLTRHANETSDGTNKLVLESEADNVNVLDLRASVATSEVKASHIDIEANGAGRAGFIAIIDYGDDTYYTSFSVQVVEEDIDDEGLEETPEEQFFSDMDIAPSLIVITMIVIALALPILFGGFMSLVLAMFFAVFAALWFVGLVPVMIVVAGWIISMMASLIEGVFG